MRKLIVILWGLSITSCNYFDVKKTSTETILNEELKTFNWKDVDEYPSFSSCDNAFQKEERKKCFTQTLINTISNQLAHQNIVVTEDVADTVVMRLQVTYKGELNVLSIKADSLTYQQIPKIDSLLTSTLNALPKIYPAVKRSQQVTTQFDLPIIVEVN
ncbi:hypothetical protein [Mangrovimonas spongiae]|uniref:TonB C-terminal domain-containing protein n=1 Tax=Mangrovimonas spongiae TaxID=2494697 RepID=A0A3R9P0X3_9FLAO|nr:hypothetical protein [Mangrovimonas spongiae]RSK41869.1 hypothetical protein EJA19_03030 [Mangrovimonas spongiae]